MTVQVRVVMKENVGEILRTYSHLCTILLHKLYTTKKYYLVIIQSSFSDL